MARMTFPLFMLVSGCATNIAVRNTEIRSRDIPKEFDGSVIVFVSDFHINRLLPMEYFEEVIDKINGLEPDVVLLGGDYVDWDTMDMDEAFRMLSRLPQGKTYGVLGNHDNWFRFFPMKQSLQDSGIILLQNDSVRFAGSGGDFVIAGIDDYLSGRPDIDKALSGVTEKDFCVLLSHSPQPYSTVKDDTRVNVMLAGHSHGGQVTFFGLWAPILPLDAKTYWRGRYDSEGNFLLITNGIGTNKLPIRIFARPAIERIVLKRETQERGD